MAEADKVACRMSIPLRLKLAILIGAISIPMLLALGMLAASWRSDKLSQVEVQLLSHAALTAERLQALQTQALLILGLLA